MPESHPPSAVCATVIVPAHNAAATLGACLNALAQQDGAAAFPFEIIVIDDASTDQTAAVAQAFAARAGVPTRVVSVGRLGKSGTRNLGAQLATADLLLFTDADCAPAADWLRAMLAPFADPRVVGVKGTYRTRQRHPIARFVQVEHAERYARMATQPAIDFIDTYSAAYRRDVFLANGGFDPQLTYSMVEDQELAFRLAGQDHVLRFAPQACVYHQHLTTVRRYVRRKFAIASWKALIVRRHPARLVRDSRTPQLLKLQMALALLLWPLLPAALVWRPARAALAGWSAVFAGSCVPFLRFALARDPLAALIAPPLLLARAVALSSGYLHGLWRWRGAAARQFLAHEPPPLPDLRATQGKPVA